METKPEVLLVARRFQVVRGSQLGRDGQPHVREWIEHPGAVTILPILPDGRVVLIRNQRIAVGETLIELPAGTLDGGEDPQYCAHRELAEETGYRAGQMEFLCEFFMSPGILHEKMHLFLATKLSPGEMALEAGEEIETLELELSAAMELVRRGEIRDAKTIAGLLFYDRFKVS